MRVSGWLNAQVAVLGLVAAALVAGVFVLADRGSSTDDAKPSGAQVRSPHRTLDVIASPTPAQSAVEISRRLYSSSPVAIVAQAHSTPAQKAAIRSAGVLGVPVLVGGSGVPAEPKRLGAATVLTFGRTSKVHGGRAMPLNEAAAAAKVATLKGSRAARDARRIDAIVVTRSRADNAAAVANATNAGAEVVEIPTADARRSPTAAHALTRRPQTPVIAVGTPFAKGFAYTLAVVRARATQTNGAYLALPGRHYVAMYGHPGSPSLGVLGEQGVRASVSRVHRLVRKYRATDRRAHFVPTFEIIATVASAGAGKDKNYSREASIKTLEPLVEAARRSGVYVVLDLQPGRTDFLTQAKRYRSLLEQPHVGLALDPEWRLKKGQKHLRQIGSVKVAEIDRTGDWLARLTRDKTRPQKLFVLHQFSPSMISHRGRLVTDHPVLATVIHVDGSGRQSAKRGTWGRLHKDSPEGVFWGWKNFVDEDKPMLDARQTWRRVTPRPDLISYQ
ncbi:hypothetical protein [Aeromicrobium sp.]|uniref:hypothetical protein n=1 Tax=Aeromicrobium sp. TaxID=1871063 RepID=UPI0019AE40D9|nr:hypothetical protein [Aeromicrobium sp.]MBC7633873.1 hypothetical protein [Aeromicrobium sp.]